MSVVEPKRGQRWLDVLEVVPVIVVIEVGVLFLVSHTIVADGTVGWALIASGLIGIVSIVYHWRTRK